MQPGAIIDSPNMSVHCPVEKICGLWRIRLDAFAKVNTSPVIGDLRWPSFLNCTRI